MARPKKTTEGEVVEVTTPKSDSKVCSAECPHFTQASKECEECWKTLHQPQ